MTRIIAGDAGGIRLGVPDAGTRPTSDRVRESLFGALTAAGVVTGAHVLDLYAGSGALGLEALSRGARSVDLVERSRQAAAVLRRNAQKVSKALGGSADIRVHERSVREFLARTERRFDLVFSDPPYILENEEMTADLIALTPRLAPGAVVVVERSRRAPQPDFTAAGLTFSRERPYGDTTLWWAVHSEGDQSR